MKRTIFEGTVNGEKFDNVAAYNARVQELIDAGKNVQASSNTRIESMDDDIVSPETDINGINRSGYVSTATNDECLPWDVTCSNYESDDPFEDDYKDEDLSFYPYCESGDPYYLDLLVTDDSDVNKEAINEARRVFDKCYSYISSSLDNMDITVDTKKCYLEDIREILADIKRDNTNNLKALSQVKLRREEAVAEYDAQLRHLKEKHESTIASLENEELILRAAKPVIDEFRNFYSTVEAEALEAIANQQALQNTCKNCGKPKNECKCDINKNKIRPTSDVTNIKTEVKETVPQTEWDFNKLMDKIFGSGFIRTRLK